MRRKLEAFSLALGIFASLIAIIAFISGKNYLSDFVGSFFEIRILFFKHSSHNPFAFPYTYWIWLLWVLLSIFLPISMHIIFGFNLKRTPFLKGILKNLVEVFAPIVLINILVAFIFMNYISAFIVTMIILLLWDIFALIWYLMASLGSRLIEKRKENYRRYQEIHIELNGFYDTDAPSDSAIESLLRKWGEIK